MRHGEGWEEVLEPEERVEVCWVDVWGEEEEAWHRRVGERCCFGMLEFCSRNGVGFGTLAGQNADAGRSTLAF